MRRYTLRVQSVNAEHVCFVLFDSVKANCGMITIRRADLATFLRWSWSGNLEGKAGGVFPKPWHGHLTDEITNGDEAVGYEQESGETEMSYDIWLEVDMGGSEPATLGMLDWNYTSNCASMWNLAGANLGEFEGKRAGDCAVALQEALAVMEANPETFRKMNPSNGWGNYETLLPRLRELLVAFLRAPEATVRVSR